MTPALAIVVLFCGCLSEPIWCDAMPDALAPVDTERGEAAKLPDPRSKLADPSVGKLCGTGVSPSDTSIVPSVAKEKIVEASCENGNCRVPDADNADTRLSAKDGRDSIPTRRFPILRGLFGRRR
jgi:hypothetical protein